MLYLDSSLLVKRYITESESAAVTARFDSGERIFTSELSYAEIFSVFGRKLHEKAIRRADFHKASDAFTRDWLFSLNILALDSKTMTAVPELVERFRLRGADAAHLSSAKWLQDMCRLGFPLAAGATHVEFGVADKKLGQFAAACGMTVFNP